MAKHSKAYRAAVEKIEEGHLYTPLEAVRLAQETSTTKYDATVEVEVQPDAIDGQLIPPRPGQITVHAPEGVVTTVETDEVGCFRVELEAGGLLRLECKSAGSRCVTEWFPW